MRERGRYQIQFMKTRSSSGVGSKVDLKFNPDTLRVEDLDEDEEEAGAETGAGGAVITEAEEALVWGTGAGSTASWSSF